MLNKKFNGLRIIFLGFVVALILACLMCGVTIREYIARIANPEQKTGNTAGARPPAGPSRRYPTQPPSVVVAPPPLPALAKAPEQAGQAKSEAPDGGLFHWEADDGTYARMKPYLGVWKGAAFTDSGGEVFMLEMREKAETPHQFSGFATFIEMPFNVANKPVKQMPTVLGQVMKRMPHYTTLAGTAANGEVIFRPVKALASGDCKLESVKVSPFGNTQLAVEWESHGCPAGDMVMKLEGR